MAATVLDASRPIGPAPHPSPPSLAQALPRVAARTEHAGPCRQRLPTEDERHRMVGRELAGSDRVRLAMPARAVPAVTGDVGLDRPLRQPSPGAGPPDRVVGGAPEAVGEASRSQTLRESLDGTRGPPWSPRPTTRPATPRLSSRALTSSKSGARSPRRASGRRSAGPTTGVTKMAKLGRARNVRRELATCCSVSSLAIVACQAAPSRVLASRCDASSRSRSMRASVTSSGRSASWPYCFTVSVMAWSSRADAA